VIPEHYRNRIALRPGEVAKIAGVAVQRVQKRLKDRTLRWVRCRDGVLVRASDVWRWLGVDPSRRSQGDDADSGRSEIESPESETKSPEDAPAIELDGDSRESESFANRIFSELERNSVPARNRERSARG